MIRNLNQNWKSSVGESNVYKEVSNLTEVPVEYITNMQRTLEKVQTKKQRTKEKDLLVYLKHINDVHGPHAVSVLQLVKDTSIVVFGEIHRNPQGCNGGAYTTMHRLVIDMMLHMPNLFLILESFFHLWVVSVDHARDLCSVLKKRQGSVHSMWNALACLSSNNHRCAVGNGHVGELILLRSFALLIQTIATHLRDAHVPNSVFYDLDSRIKFMDCREDLALVPWEWIQGTESEKLRKVSAMLSKALQGVIDFIPAIRCDDLRRMYTSNVDIPLTKKIQDCIEKPSQEQYEEIFTQITELVTIATLFNCLEGYYEHSGKRAQFVIVVGDKHREYIVKLLTQCLGDKVLTRYDIVGHQASCVNMNNHKNNRS